MVPLWMFPMAIAAGNTFILKPSEKVPAASLYLAELMNEAGFPPGVMNVLNGERVAVDRLTTHPDVKAVSFVGSTPVARHIQAISVAHGKRVQALAGAKNHMIVLPDADIGFAADAAVNAGFGSAGERCMAVSVVVAVGEIADPLVAAISERMEALVVGPGDDESTDMGPLITREHRERVAGYVAAGAEAGAEVVVDGRALELESDGFYIGPTLIDRVRPEMTVYTDEIFGPVLSVVRVDTYDQGIELIASNQWGNGAVIFTRDGGAARRFQTEVEAGMVGINVPIPVPVGYFSFGGWGESLFGDTHMYGPEGFRFWTRNKVVTSRWPDPSTSAVDLGFPRNG
jgi:malonate-semialdehyde dehydrogenase (acetylating)/methylmalonate-semialdehyde dehydrogenase